MAISGVNFGNTILGQSTRNLTDQFSSLQTQLTTGKKSTTYAGMGVNEGFAIAARAQLSGMDAFSDAMAKVNTTIGVANLALQTLASIGNQVQTAAASPAQTIGSDGQTPAQNNAEAQLASMLGILNTRCGDRYVFSGAAITTPATATADAILDGDGAAAGLRQVIAERKQADLGASGLGRLVLARPTATSVSIAEDAPGSPFGLKLSAVNSSLSGATVSGPAGSPAAVSIDFGASNPGNGDRVSFAFKLPDGTSEQIQLTASSAIPTPAGSFAIGATPAATAANLNAALTSSIGTLANTSLVAASAVQASSNFFDQPPQRVNGAPLNAATSLVAGTAANTVAWYTGEDNGGPARASSIARVDSAVIVQFGARANEPGIRNQLQQIAVFAAVKTPPGDPNGPAQIAGLSQRVTQNLAKQDGAQTIQDIQADFSAAQVTADDAKSRQTQSRALLQGVIDQAENISPNEVATQLLALQNALQASYQTTSMLAQLSLVKFL